VNKGQADAEVLKAFRAHEAQERIFNTQVGCFLVVTLMPAGSLLDFFVYPDQLWPFFRIRLICSAIAGVIWASLHTGLGRRCGRWLGLVVPLLPVIFIAWMIAIKDGFASPYYAGLNLVLLAVGAVLRWRVIESLIGVVAVLLIYIAAGLKHGVMPAAGVMVNNFYFIALMDIIVVVGTYYENRARFSEFALRFELDRNRLKLEETNQKLLELDQIKSRFFANISHELRTPLTLLLAPIETLLHRARRALDQETRELLATMHANGMRLLKLINDLLDLVRLESGRMEVKREPVAMDAFVRGLLSAVRPAAEDKWITVSADVRPDAGTVLVDRDKLEKILLNLLFNGLKFTPSGGRLELRAFRQDNELVIAVRDTGVGIAPQNLAHVFDRFWQADTSSKRKYQGMGIGLALVKEFVEIQGGRVAVASEEGKGTTFTVRVPYLDAVAGIEPKSAGAADVEGSPPAEATHDDVSVASEEWLANLYRRAELFPAMTTLQDSLRPVETAQGRPRAKVLLADDEPDMLRFLKSQLAPQYEVLEAVDGQQALEKASQFLPDLIVLDMMMPQKDGLQACRELRERTPTQAIPVIMLTARADEETKLAALSAGASDFLAKPFSTTELHVRIKNLVESHSYQKKLARQNTILESTIEQLKETEMQLIQTEKLASLGRMSAGIIHEINNPLNFASTGLYTLRKKAALLAEGERGDYAEVLGDIEEGIDRVKTIVSDLRSFTHPDDTPVDTVRVPEVVAAALRFTSDQWKNKIQLEQDVPEDLAIRANRNRLIQVLVNLLQNSLDAIRNKTYAGNETPTIRVEGRVAGGKTMLVVRDNATGIAPEHLDKIFDPFFTTKDVGEGMGLGLSICHRIMQDYSGQIRVKTEQGKYCEITLEFPNLLAQ
jgi:signal transduction histidine kinase